MGINASSKYVTDLVNAPGDWVVKNASSSFGAAVTGTRMHVGLVHKARGTGSRLHRHLNEQFNFVLRGTLVGEIDGEPFRCPKGHVVHIPANTPHTIIADPNDEDVIFYVCKDTSAPLGGNIVLDGEADGPRVEEGFRVDESAERKRDFS